MPNDPQPPAVPAESLARKHEVSDRRVRNVLMIGGAAAFLVFVGLFCSGVLMLGFARNRPMQHMGPLGLILAPDGKPLDRFSKPNLDTDDDCAQRVDLYAAQSAHLNSYIGT